MREKQREKLKSFGYERTLDIEGKECWSRPTIVGAPKNQQDDKPVDIFIEINQDDSFNIAVDTFNKYAHVNIEVKGIPAERMLSHLKSLEVQAVYAWRELAD